MVGYFYVVKGVEKTIGPHGNSLGSRKQIATDTDGRYFKPKRVDSREGELLLTLGSRYGALHFKITEA